MTEQKRALITGITGQDGSYLAEFLVAKGYDVHGMIRRSSTFGTQRIEHLYRDVHSSDRLLSLHYGDMADGTALSRLVRQVKPHEVYNLAAQSHVRVSFDQPIYTADVTAMGTSRLLEAIRDTQEETGQQIRFYQASSSEMFGKVAETPQTEMTPFRPRSPYAVAKVYAHCATVNCREAYGLHASCGILFNHESPRRGETFVTRKITMAVANIVKGNQKEIWMGNLDSIRDWGYAPEYTDGMWRMLQANEPDDFVLATGSAYTIKDFLSLAFEHVGLNWEDYVKFDPKFLRPTEVDELIGDASKAKEKLGWEAEVLPPELAKIMVDADIARLDGAPEGGF